VEIAHKRDPKGFYVQGDLRRPPFQAGAFEALYSNGVLHHTPDPQASFQAVTRLLKPDGCASIWVYGLKGMRLSYRLSHLSWMRPLSNALPRSGQLALTAALTASLEMGIWTPAQILRRLGLGAWADRLPYQDAAQMEWRYKFRRVFDRLNPPITHYIAREDLERWFEDFWGIQILNPEGQGWTARGRKKTA